MDNNNIYSKYKSARILYLYTKLMNGESICKADEAEHFNVDARTIQRDIDELRAFFDNQEAEGKTQKALLYNRTDNRYFLMGRDESFLTNSEILAVSKILLESRAFCKDDMEVIINKLLDSCVPKENKSIVQSLVGNEMRHYIEPRHRQHFIEEMWDIGEAIKNQCILNIDYERPEGKGLVKIVSRRLKPVAIMFSEFYFYLTAFIDGIDKNKFENPDDIFPTIYRIDRIRNFKILDEHFKIPYRDRFEDGEFRKRIQFMYGGRLKRIKFKYTGKNVEAVLDRLPTAKIISEKDGSYVITAEVFGNGIDMWLKSQGNTVEVIE